MKKSRLKPLRLVLRIVRLQGGPLLDKTRWLPSMPNIFGQERAAQQPLAWQSELANGPWPKATTPPASIHIERSSDVTNRPDCMCHVLLSRRTPDPLRDEICHPLQDTGGTRSCRPFSDAKSIRRRRGRAACFGGCNKRPPANSAWLTWHHLACRSAPD
ncbi:hypothetical protein BT67DRAFT_301723 [Trichocladium antarcticum]|uniref:Uncharacterized protein n=1 Tax=Trichocladium antarcticum TaxID=1450529 RepID=A0AAN6UL00_9PEZI|nr:hypothetical protein BT67DRAFT_301723 [Trichocladium antarcticum]